MAMLWGTKRFGTYAASFITTGWTYAFAMLIAHRIWGLTPASACLIWGLSRLLDATSLIGCSLYRTRLGRPDRTLLRSALRFGIRSAAGELATSTNARADQSIMGAISPERELGLYAVAVNAGEVLLYLPNAVGSAIVPNLVETGYDELEATTLRAFRMVFAVTTVAVVGAAIAGTLLIPLVFGAKFEGSITPFLLLLPGAWGYAAQKVFSSALTGLGQPGRSSLGPLTALLTGLALDAVLIPLYGAQGAAGAASAAFIAGGIASLVAFDLAVPFPLRALLPTAADARTIAGVVSGYRARRRTSRNR
jgi:O-antigen/teichoic acid export membrane protein